MNHKGRRLMLVLAMLLVSMLPIGLPLSPLKQAHAVVPTLQQKLGNACGPVTSCGITLVNPVTAGDVLVFTGLAPAPLTITDSQSQTWTVTTTAGGTTAYVLEQATTNSLTVTVHGSSGNIVGFVYDLSGATTVGVCQANGTGTGSMLTTSTTCPITGAFGAALIQGINAIGGPVLQSGWLLLSVSGNFGIYSLGTAASPTNFPASNNGISTTWGDAGIVIQGAAPVGPATFVTPCTFFQLQCWWYPLFFNIAFAATYLVVAFLADASTKAELYMLLCGLSISGLISIILAVLPITFPLLMVISHIAYTLRLRGII